MWDYNSIGPTIFILLIIFVFYMTRPRLPIRSRYSFMSIMIIEFLTIIIEVISSIFDEQYYHHSMGELYLVNTLYFVIFFMRSLLFFAIVMYLLKMSVRDNAFFTFTIAVVHLVSQGIVISSYWTGAIFKIDNTGYKTGPLYNLLYIHAIFFIAMSIILLVYRRKAISRKKIFTIAMYILILIAGYAIRYFFPKYLVMDMFSTMDILIIYLEFENPEFYLNRKTGLFGYESLKLLINEWNEIFDYKIIGFSIKSYTKNREYYSANAMDRGLSQIAHYLRKECKRMQCFYLKDGRFAIITRNKNEEEIVKKIKKRFDDPWIGDKVEMYLEVEFAIYDSKCKASTDTIMKALRMGLKETNVTGEDVIYINKKTMDKIARQRAVKLALERALDDYSVDVLFQPQVRASDHKLVGAEALVRIDDSIIGRVKPEEFIPIAEKNGTIVRLGKQVLEKTCDFYNKYGTELGLTWINVNVSPVQCRNKNLMKEFQQILSKYNISPDTICLEITEKSIIDYDIMVDVMEKLKELGFKLALDDYGSGYSNAISLVKYPLSNIKLDREIVSSYFKEGAEYLSNEIGILKNMGFTVTAEGIENEEMAERLKEFGCDYLQGYLFSMPLRIEDFVNLYKK